jgi:hypothetical protein
MFVYLFIIINKWVKSKLFVNFLYKYQFQEIFLKNSKSITRYPIGSVSMNEF